MFERRGERGIVGSATIDGEDLTNSRVFEIWLRQYWRGSLLKKREEEVETGSTHDFSIRCDWGGELNSKSVVIHWTYFRIFWIREIDVKIFDVEAIERLDAATRDVDDD